MKPTKKLALATSFHNAVVNASVEQLKQALGEPQFSDNYGNDKVNFEWIMETNEGEVFTIYDWKEYRVLEEDEIIEWHIGSHTIETSNIALTEILNVLCGFEKI